MRKILAFISLSISVICLGQSSVLSSGQWYKIGITESGIYRIDQSTLASLGIPSSVDPNQIQLFGNGVKGILPQQNSEERPIDLIENPILIEGGAEGSFDGGDYILFHGVGPHKETWSAEGFEFERNIYSDTAYYFIRIDGENGKRIQVVENPDGEPSTTFSSFNDHIAFEEDEVNLISSGRRWMGEILSSGEILAFNYLIEGLVSDLEGQIVLVNQSPDTGTFEITKGDELFATINIDEIPSGPEAQYERKGEEAIQDLVFPADENFNFQLQFKGRTADSRGFLDRFYFIFERELSLYGTSTAFRTAEMTSGLKAYQIENAAGATVWNVTDPENVYEQAYDIDGAQIEFRNVSDNIEEYIVFSGSDFPSPFVFGSVENQNLRGSSSFDGIIVSPAAFLSEAQRLADFHLANDGLRIHIVTPNQIYNEFSSGRQDVTAIRDYARYVYTTGSSLKYLLLFGDCSYDYKDRVIFNTNLVPTYEARESFDPIYSYSSDDFFAFFEDSEGEWEENRAGDHTMEIGVGRLPVKSLAEAATVVDKIIYYTTSPNTLGAWRNEITYVADDGDFNRHADDVEQLSELVDTTFTQYNISKILVDAFDQEAGASKDLSPQAATALKTQIKNGAFVVNFLGHGSENLWTEEEVLTQEDIAELTNRNRLPIFVTATCEFGRYDDPLQVSGAEALMLLETGGGIALLTTSRPVFASSNFALNEAFHEGMYSSKDRLGDIIRRTKNNGLRGPNNRNFTLLGDPMMRPAFPTLDIALQDFGSTLDTLSALETVTLSGEIQNNGTTQTDFTGQLIVGVYDDLQEFETQGQENSPYSYALRSNIIFKGEATVEDGKFDISFMVPKNISYQFEEGKISMYAWDYDRNIDAAGSSGSFVVGGTYPNAVPDLTPPTINMYLNDESFVNGGSVGSSPLLIARINDESGVTTSSIGVVEGIVLEVAGQTINLNDFYTSSKDSFQEGTVIYPLVDLEPGNYQASLKVWDTHNNSSVAQIEFKVSDEPAIFIFNEEMYPNPASDYTKFYFEHDREDEDLEIEFIVYNSSGETLYLEEYLVRNASRSIEIEWDLTTNSGQRLFQGIYYSRILIKSNFDGAVKEIARKLVLSK